MSQPHAGPSQPRPDSSRYSLEVIRVDGIHRRSRKGRLSVEVVVNTSFKTCVSIGQNGQPTSDATLLFSQLGSSSVINVAFNHFGADTDDRLLGHAEIEDDVSALLHKSLPYEFKRGLISTSPKERIVTAGTIHFRLDLTDPWDRAKLCVDMAERMLKDMSKLADRISSADNTIGTVIKAVDQIKDIIDVVTEIHPLINLSWKAVSVVYKVVSYQFETDTKLVDMACKMKDAFYLSSEARSLDDRTEMLLRTKIKSLLDETAQCSRLVQEYAARSFAGRLLHWPDRHKIDEFKDRFDYLRKELDSVITVNVGKGVDDIGCRQLLDTLVDPTKMDISKMSTRARCLKGTRENYLDEIMSVLFPGRGGIEAASDVDRRFVWLTGAAGVGKSTIALTIADLCDSKGSPTAYLFFERGKDEYISAVRAIAYRVATCYPSIQPHIARAVKANTNISGSPLQMQFEKLVLEPILAAAIQQPIVIILDALDECGTMSQRKDIVSLLVNDFADLPSQVRILVTSRPESDIMKHLSSKGLIHHIEFEHTSRRARRDVGRYIREKLVAAVDQGPPKGWEWDEVCETLSDAADGLFIWASTAIKMIDDSSNKRRKLRALLLDIKSVGGGIDGLFATVLQQSGISWDEPETRSEFVRILGVILFAKEALSGEDIESFLDLEEDTVDAILKPLRSVLFYESGEPVRLHHASFADYLMSERSDSRPWHVEESAQKQVIAERCFATMGARLHFNMCGLPSSFMRNDDIPGLADQIKSQIPPYLKYACFYWDQHLIDVPYIPGLLEMLSEFAHERLLFWFEVLSLTKAFGCFGCFAALSDASRWSEHDDGLASFLEDARKLASMFESPIMRSTPHIYVSMIPLSKGASEVATHYSKFMSAMIRIDRMGVQRPPLCLKVLEGQSGGKGVAFAPNGKHLASALWNDTVKVWDIDSGEEIFTPLKGRAVCFSPDGDHIATGCEDGMMRFWDAQNGNLVLGPLEGHTRVITSVSWSPDGSRIVSGSEDNTVILWDKDGRTTFRLEGHEGGVTSVAFSPDSARLASGSWDGTIRIWDVKSGRLVFGPFVVHSELVNSVTFSPDGAHLVSGSFDSTIKIWEVESGNVISTLEGYTGSVRSVAYTPCGTRIVSGSRDRTIKVWDAESGNIICSLEGHTNWVYAVAISRDGKYIASGSDDETIRIWDGTAATSISKTSTKHVDAIMSVTFSQDGTRIASASTDQPIIVWDAETGNVALGPLPGHTKGVSCVASVPNGSRLLSGSWDNTIRIWDAETGESVMGPLVDEDYIDCIAVSPDGKTVVSCIWKGISVWRIATGQLVTRLLVKSYSKLIRSVAFSPNGKQLASGSGDGTIIIWGADSWEEASFLTGHSVSIESVCFSPDGTRLASGSLDKNIIIWDTENGQKVAGPFEGHTNTVFSIVYSLDGGHIISGSWDGSIRVWDVRSGSTICKLEGHSSQVLSVSLSPDSRRIVSGSSDKTIRVWDMADILQPSMEITDSAGTSSSEWVLTAGGWILGGEGQRDLLMWIPPDLHDTLWRPRTLAVMSCDFSTRLDFTDAAIGTRWSECFVPLESRT